MQELNYQTKLSNYLNVSFGFQFLKNKIKYIFVFFDLLDLIVGLMPGRCLGVNNWVVVKYLLFLLYHISITQ